jgi:hypothetical protein
VSNQFLGVLRRRGRFLKRRLVKAASAVRHRPDLWSSGLIILERTLCPAVSTTVGWQMLIISVGKWCNGAMAKLAQGFPGFSFLLVFLLTNPKELEE